MSSFFSPRGQLKQIYFMKLLLHKNLLIHFSTGHKILKSAKNQLALGCLRFLWTHQSFGYCLYLKTVQSAWYFSLLLLSFLPTWIPGFCFFHIFMQVISFNMNCSLLNERQGNIIKWRGKIELQNLDNDLADIWLQLDLFRICKIEAEEPFKHTLKVILHHCRTYMCIHVCKVVS